MRRARSPLDHAANALAVLGVLVLLSGSIASPTGPFGPLLPPAATDRSGPVHSQGLATEPTWERGETWWLRITDLHSPHPYDIRITAGGERTQVLGARPADFATAFLLNGIVPMGDLSGFSFEVHDMPFQLLDFPLTHGKTWRTEFRGEPVVARVQTHAGLATVTFTGPSALAPTLTMAYDPTLAFPRSIEGPGAAFLVVAHESGSSCGVVTPSRLDLAFDEGRERATGSSRPAAPVRTVTVPGGYDALAVGVSASSLSLQRAAVQAPDGTTYATPLGAEHKEFGAAFHHAAPAGTWQLERASLGPGYARATGLAYALAPLDAECGSGTSPSSQSLVPALPSPAQGPWHWLAAGVLEAAAMLVRFRRALGQWLPALLIVPLFARLSRERVLRHAKRQAILGAVAAAPGSSTQDVRRRCGLAWSEARYHLELLEAHGALDAVRWGRSRRWFVADETEPGERLQAAALERPGAKAVLHAIRAAPGASLAEVARGLGVHHSTVAYHLSGLERAELARRERVGRGVRCYPA